MKLLILLNENPVGSHEDVYRAIENCYNKGIVNDKLIFPFLAKLTEGKKEKQVLKEIIDISKEYLPNLILWMHTDRFKVDLSFLNELKDLISKPVMGYWDGDLYQSPYRHVPNELLELSVLCDVVFAQGFGEMTEKMKSKGCNDIRFVPAFADEKRFYPIRSVENKVYDIVMIGNNIKSRIPFRITMPGTKLRRRLVTELCKEYKKKFAVFGNNWKGNCANGISSYLDQHKIYSRSRITIAINNLSGKYYFSDRLPIAMLSGIPIIHKFEDGFNELFDDFKEIRFFKSFEEAFQICQELLQKSDSELNEIGEKLYNYALNKFSVEFVFQYMIDVLKEKYYNKNEINFNYKVLNPWLNIMNVSS